MSWLAACEGEDGSGDGIVANKLGLGGKSAHDQGAHERGGSVHRNVVIKFVLRESATLVD